MSMLLISIYVVAIVLANTIVWVFGPWVSPINAFVLIGLDLTLRDVMHERLTRIQMALVVCSGGFLTWILNPASSNIAIASSVAFTIAACADWGAYYALGSYRWSIKVNGSNAVGSAVDSIIFPTMAFGAFLPQIIVLQFIAKLIGGFIWSIIMRPILVPYKEKQINEH